MDPLTPEVRQITLNLMEGLDCPRSLSVAILMRYGEWEQLFSLQCPPSQHNDAESYGRAAAATGFLKKLNVRVPDLNPKANAVAKWLEAERQCFRTNRRLNEISDFGTLCGEPVSERILGFLADLRKNVVKLIGDRPPQCVDGRFGPGATVSDNSAACTILHKMSSRPTLTPSALFYLVPWTGTKWAAAAAARGDEVDIVRGNYFFTVPKDATIARCCAKEPSLNVYYQLGYGRVLRDRLKENGIDLDNGKEVHMRVACASSITEEFATIDLSSASDTVCTALVRLALPPPWYEVLNDLRSDHTCLNKKHWYRLEKFSSMGNGFTFELETLLFAALCMTTAGLQPGKNLWVYGDDIIVPKGSAHEVTKTLEFFGFTLNKNKTFIEGPFRESCGGDYWEGQVVRPHFLKEIPNEPQQYISLANGIRRLSLGNRQGIGLHPCLRRTWFSVLDQLPTDIRACRGPEELGDLLIHDDEERWRVRWRASKNQRYFRVYRPCSFLGVRFDRFDSDIQFAAALKQMPLFRMKPNPRWPPGFDKRETVMRDGVLGYKLGWALFS